MPLYSAGIASVALADEPLRARLVAGIAVAIGGLALAFGESIALGDAKWALLAATACAIAPLCAAIGNVSIKRRGQRVDPIVRQRLGHARRRRAAAARQRPHRGLGSRRR